MLENYCKTMEKVLRKERKELSKKPSASSDTKVRKGAPNLNPANLEA